jgi:hypothetical protein
LRTFSISVAIYLGFAKYFLLHDIHGTSAGLYFAAITSPVGVHRCKPYSKLCTKTAINMRPTAVHVNGTNNFPPLPFSNSPYEKTVPKAPPSKRVKKVN